jgi:DNA-binding beta-propeller fold protein YncE
LFASNSYSNSVDVLLINTSNGHSSLASTTLLETGCAPTALAVTPDGKSLHVACSGGASKLLGYGIDAVTAALSPLATAVSGVAASSIIFVSLP